MKRYLFLFLLVISFLLTACNKEGSKEQNLEALNDKEKMNYISSVNITDRESAILATTTSYANVFEFNVEDSYNKASVWIEKFVEGKPVEARIGPMTKDIEEKGSIIFTTSSPPQKRNDIIFEIGIHSLEGTSALHNIDTIPAKGLENISSMTDSISRVDVSDEEIVLASICFSGDRGMSSLSPDFYKDMKHHMDELKRYEVVYVLKGKFLK
ncbi:hypothetical protein KO561_00080 [Radiobacillus kanasensis]|uniref:hypothetical protein n=1 Tax=Radiobacillus kanasensis TaxID=2844358 RepID=UPI001E5FBCC9|nr:hypothetical protein [Radiobacillus kanasensis]UFT99442.1 hypothetical protein KO561_00080 [Radiobacillus kanasensis]